MPFIRVKIFWANYHHFDPDVRDKKTYQSLDSISNRAGLEWKLKLARRVIFGYIPLGPVDLRITDLVAYNNYEGFRPGIGGMTNDRFFTSFQV